MRRRRSARIPCRAIPPQPPSIFRLPRPPVRCAPASARRVLRPVSRPWGAPSRRASAVRGRRCERCAVPPRACGPWTVLPAAPQCLLRRASPRACRRCLRVRRCRDAASITRPLRSAVRESRQANACMKRFVDSGSCCQTDSCIRRARMRVARTKMRRRLRRSSARRVNEARRGAGDAPRRRRGAAHRPRVSRAGRAARPAAAPDRCRRRAGGSAGCRPPARRRARPSR